jgi:hypothetical protein
VTKGRRPSYRMECATTLVESVYAGRPEVKQALMTATHTDTVGVSRGHCIALLGLMGVTDSAYVDNLEKWSKEDEPAVARAADEILKKLGRR